MKKITFLDLLLGSLFATGQNQLPNNSFENWTADTIKTPDGYVSSADYKHKTLPSTDAVSGQYSLYMETEVDSFFNDTSAGFIVNFDPDNFSGGVPFTFHADSLCGYYKANIQGQDTAWIFAMFKFNGTPIGMASLPISANENTSTWTRFSVPTGMPSMFNPDSMMFGAVSSNYLGSGIGITSGSVLMLDSIYFKSSSNAVDTLNNYDFERWTDNILETLDGYNTSAVWEDIHIPMHTVEKVTSSTNGNFAVKLNNVVNIYGDTIGGAISTADISTPNYPPPGGTPFDWSPISVTYDFQCNRTGSEPAYIDFIFKKNGAVIESQFRSYGISTTSYATETINFSFSQTPDTLIFRAYNGRTPGDWFMIDNIVFNYPVGITENIEILQAIAYPVPSKDNLNFTVNSKDDQEVILQISSIDGKVLINKQITLSAGINNFTVSVSDLPAGNYIYTFTTNDQQFSKSFIKE